MIDPSGALNTISIAVSDATLTENVDPENPGGEENPDPEEPDKPGEGEEEKPDPEEPDKPDEGGEENPDPDEPENPGGEENPDPDKPGEGEDENPGGSGTDEPTEITFDSWEELMNAGDGVVQDAVFEILKDNLLTESVIKSMFGNSMKPANLEDGTIEILQWAFDTNDSNEITAIEVMGIRHGYPTATSVRVRTARFDLNTSIALDSIGAGASSSDNTISYPDGEGEVTIDLSAIATGTTNGICKINFIYDVTDQNLNDTMKSYFDLCMPLAVEAGLIDANAKLGFVSVQVSGGVIGSEFGNAINANLQFIDLNTNMKYNISILFADTRTNGSTTMLDEMKKAVASGEYRVRAIQDNLQIISGDQIFETEDWENIVTYTIPTENQK